MKKLFFLVLSMCLVFTMISTSFAVDYEEYYYDGEAIETFEETTEEVDGTKGGTICVLPEAGQEDTTGISVYDESKAYFTFNEFWMVVNKNDDASKYTEYNKIIKDENGNHMLKVDYNMFFLLKLDGAGEAFTEQTGFSMDMKPTNITGFTGMCLRSRHYGCLDQHSACADGIKYPHECGIGFTLDPANKQNILIYVYTGSEVGTSVAIDTGIDLTADFHNYAVYDDYEGGFIFLLDNKIIATAQIYMGDDVEMDDNRNMTTNCVIKDADGKELLNVDNAIMYMDPTSVEIEICGEGMEVYLDNIGIVNGSDVPPAATETPKATETPIPETTETPAATETPIVTDIPETSAEAATDEPSKSSGCGGFVSESAFILIALAGTFLVLNKKGNFVFL